MQSSPPRWATQTGLIKGRLQKRGVLFGCATSHVVRMERVRRGKEGDQQQAAKQGSLVLRPICLYGTGLIECSQPRARRAIAAMVRCLSGHCVTAVAYLAARCTLLLGTERRDIPTMRQFALVLTGWARGGDIMLLAQNRQVCTGGRD